jgi:hypothetical protein
LISKSFTKIGQLSNKESKVMEHFLFLTREIFSKVEQTKRGPIWKESEKKVFFMF